MALSCYFQYDNGRFCKKFAKTGSRFCHNHQPPAHLADSALTQSDAGPSDGLAPASAWPQVHPHLRLASPTDLFALVRETLHATRTGAVTPSQAFAISSLCTVWLRVYDGMLGHQRLEALQHQILPSLVSAEAAAEAERLARLTADAEHRADHDPRSLDTRNPWAAGLMAGPVYTESAEGGPSAPDAYPSDTRGGSVTRPLDASSDSAPSLLENDGAPAPTAPGGHGFSHAETMGANAPSSLPKAHAESAGRGATPGGHGFSHAEPMGANAPTSLPKADAEGSDPERHSVAPPRTPRQPINLREAQAKLEAMLAEQAAARDANKVPPKPNGGAA